MAKHLDEQVTAFRNRPLDAGPYTFVWVDALTQKVREGGRIINVHALIAVGVNADGHREILGIDVATAALCHSASGERKKCATDVHAVFARSAAPQVRAGTEKCLDCPGRTVRSFR